MEKGKRIIVDQDKCELSGRCIQACPEKAISIGEGKVIIDKDKCDLDGMCIPACPHSAIRLGEE